MAYKPLLDLRQTERAIRTIKEFFQTNLAEALNLLRVSAPLFVLADTGINDNLNGVELPASFAIKGMNGRRAEMVQSLAKWKRMALADYGIACPPGELNARLKRVGGYTGRGWLEWAAIEQITGRRVGVRVADAPSHAEPDRALREGHCAVVKSLLRGGVRHWVLVVGKAGREYLVKDPLGTGVRLDRLSDLSPEIHSLRIVVPLE